jgi:hypothetical protein
MNNEFIKDVKKAVKKQSINQELTPGSSPRRYEPKGGLKKYREKIHKESKYADNYKNLPFSFRKPPKPVGRPSNFVCDSCGHVISGTKSTVGVICSACGKFSTVTEV